MSFVMSLEVSDLMDLLETAFNKKEEEKAWQMWLTLYPQMGKENFVPFSQFYKKLKQPDKRRLADDLLREAAEIQAKIAERRGLSGTV